MCLPLILLVAVRGDRYTQKGRRDGGGVIAWVGVLYLEQRNQFLSQIISAAVLVRRLELLAGTYVIVPELSTIGLIVRPSKKACQALSPRKRRFYEIADHRLRSLLLACNLPLRPPAACPLSREFITLRGPYGMMDDQASPRNPPVAVAPSSGRSLALAEPMAEPGRLKAVVLISRSGTELAKLDRVKAIMN